jgi:hypothetical protein
MVIENINNKLSWNRVKLPVRELHDIVIDASKAENGQQATEEVKEALLKINENMPFQNGIVRISVFISDRALYKFNRENIRKFVKTKLQAHNCLKVFPQIITERQMRKASITEKRNPIQAYTEYLDLIEDERVKEKMKEVGLKIMKERILNASS